MNEAIRLSLVEAEEAEKKKRLEEAKARQNQSTPSDSTHPSDTPERAASTSSYSPSAELSAAVRERLPGLPGSHSNNSTPAPSIRFDGSPSRPSFSPASTVATASASTSYQPSPSVGAATSRPSFPALSTAQLAPPLTTDRGSSLPAMSSEAGEEEEDERYMGQTPTSSLAPSTASLFHRDRRSSGKGSAPPETPDSEYGEADGGLATSHEYAQLPDED